MSLCDQDAPKRLFSAYTRSFASDRNYSVVIYLINLISESNLPKIHLICDKITQRSSVKMSSEYSILTVDCTGPRAVFNNEYMKTYPCGCPRYRLLNTAKVLPETLSG